MSMRIEVPPISTDEALARIVAWLRTGSEPSRRHGETFRFNTDDVHKELWDETRSKMNLSAGAYHFDSAQGNRTFFDAVRDLVRRGIVRPDPIRPDLRPVLTGTYFVVTNFGESWLQNSTSFDVVPAEYGRFSRLLQGHSARFGAGFSVRANQAVACYRATAFYACCTMCGAAAESIILSLAIAKSGDETKTLGDYNRSNGRATIEKQLVGGKNGHIQRQLTSFFELLKYWRDSAAPGAVVEIGEEEAFTSLLLLLRLASFADERWDDITT